jgi:plastocyanin
MSRVASLLIMMAGTASLAPLGAQATVSVSGQISLMERPGEKTEDLTNAVIYLEPPASAKPKLAGPTNTAIDMQNRQFLPHVRVVTAGSKVAFPNKDPWKHNVFSKATQGPFDTDQYGAGKTKDNVFKQAGIYPIYCNIHPRMTAYVVAMATPYYVQPGADGRFTVGKVPPGTYTLHVWHERATPQKIEVTVSATGLAGLRYQLDARNYKYAQHKDKFGKDYVFTGDIY